MQEGRLREKSEKWGEAVRERWWREGVWILSRRVLRVIMGPQRVICVRVVKMTG